MSEYDGEPNELGKITWMCSEEGSGPDVGITVELANGATLWCGEITKRQWEEAGEDVAELGDDFGAWILMHAGGESSVVAKCATPEIGREMIEQIATAIRAATPAQSQ